MRSRDDCSGLSEGAIGQVVTFDRGRTSEQRTVIGVVENTADASLRDRSTPTAYLPVAGEQSSHGSCQVRG